MVLKFVNVMQRDYKQVLQAIQNALASGLSGDDALNAAFEVLATPLKDGGTPT
jgi:glutamate synthase (ferredoxin)